ncbi:hypothetical protein CDL12_05857 [Handroanthus impetiginosus]|uniref:WRKY domain-containing protein n=1 Tax=Handroanthus impetiginosus TaxID=429701 RepID=A0A2G9HVF2_9LAMI|nr:hypothetical protein CDL12_05857 [Handroanthus impetiginosus]
MDSRFNNQKFVSEPEEYSENSPENSGGDSPRSAVSPDTKIASTSSSRRSRRAIQKRVVSVPIKDVEGLRLKGDQMSAPPSDSWAWRKYGQKPIKGSPYPRGYYRCSSSKGCPARKQVERSRVDPTMLVVTYSCEHNHPWPASRNHHQTITSAPAAAAAAANNTNVTTLVSEELEEEEAEEEEKKPMSPSNQSQELIPVYKFSNLSEGPLVHGSEFGWFADFDSTNCTMLESPFLTEDRITTDKEMAMIFTMREEDESLFADLGELPECSTVFRRGMAQREAGQRRPSLATTT